MKIYYQLLKKQTLILSRFYKIAHGNEKERKTYIWIYAVITLGAGIFAFWWFRSIYGIALRLDSAQKILRILIHPLVTADILAIFLSSLIKDSGIVYTDQNTEILFSYPIKIRDIVLSKILFVYAGGLLLSLVLLIVPLHRYIAWSGDWLLYLPDILQLVILPAVPTLLGILTGRVIHGRLNRLVPIQSYIRGFLYLIALIGFLGFMFSFFSDRNFDNVYERFIAKNSFFQIHKWDFFSHTLQNYILLVLATLCSALLLLYIIKTYKRKCQSIQLSSFKTFSQEYYKKRIKVRALFLRERHRYYSTPVYLINTALGIIIILLFTIYTCFQSDQVMSWLNAVGQIYHVKDTSVLAAFVIGLMVVLTNTAYASISIEGRGHEILRGLPVSCKDILSAKYIFHLSLTLPVLFVSTVVLGITLKMKMAEAVLCFVLPAALSAFTGMLGLFMNALLPNYDWENVTYVVKQSPAAVFTLTISVALASGTFWMILKFFHHVTVMTSYIVAALYTLAAVIIKRRVLAAIMRS